MKRGRTEEWTKWRGLVSEQIASRQTVAAFCRDRGLRDWQLYDWKKRVREGEAAKFVAVKVAAVAKQAPAAAGRAIEVRLPRGRSVVIEPGFDARHRMRRKIGKVDCLPVLVSERGAALDAQFHAQDIRHALAHHRPATAGNKKPKRSWATPPGFSPLLRNSTTHQLVSRALEPCLSTA